MSWKSDKFWTLLYMIALLLICLLACLIYQASRAKDLVHNIHHLWSMHGLLLLNFSSVFYNYCPASTRK